MDAPDYDVGKLAPRRGAIYFRAHRVQKLMPARAAFSDEAVDKLVSRVGLRFKGLDKKVADGDGFDAVAFKDLD